MGKMVEMTGLPHLYIIMAGISGLAAFVAASNVVFTHQDLK
jgi:NAD/NADP transhydrogenase beta subunit